jgi:hypothetical protein
MLTYSCPNIPAKGHRAFVSARSYLFRLACSRTSPVTPLTLQTCRPMFRAASDKARVIAARNSPAVVSA